MQTLLATRPIGRHASLIVLPAALLAAHCGGTQSQSLTNPSTHSAVVTLRVGVAGNVAPTIAPGERLQLWAAATYADGASGDVTNAALWQSSNPAVATVSREGLLSAAADTTCTAVSPSCSPNDRHTPVVHRPRPTRLEVSASTSPK